MKLLASATSPYARKLRVIAHELGIALPVEDTAPMTDPASLLSANPLGKVPALVLDDGSAIIDSPVIAAFLLASVPGQGLLPQSGHGHWQGRTTEALADGVLDASIILRFNMAQGITAGPWVDRQYRAIERALCVMNGRVGGSGFGDICITVACDYLSFRFPDLDWRTHNPALVGLTDRLLATPAFVATRPPA
ncbi:glutathione S-transferase N-terminal domain-containing protein [Sandarakinorhabdus oryzae]|uniref:glutathione S-transferase N-terminal domain-containing protein n=1 Tax=Sandarakinorhabdus oryzae TaxID=2675220 RepID=UPI0012E2F9E1|nr:glutathione S-transferase N-terminal domain-containing protein [Sandarakinorhabdus oryzae]